MSSFCVCGTRGGGARFLRPANECRRLIPEGAVDPKYVEESMDTPDTGSFMHLHLGIDGKGLDDLDIHYSVSTVWTSGRL